MFVTMVRMQERYDLRANAIPIQFDTGKWMRSILLAHWIHFVWRRFYFGTLIFINRNIFHLEASYCFRTCQTSRKSNIFQYLFVYIIWVTSKNQQNESVEVNRNFVSFFPALCTDSLLSTRVKSLNFCPKWISNPEKYIFFYILGKKWLEKNRSWQFFEWYKI